jgi:ZIP family zinc transporter
MLARFAALDPVVQALVAATFTWAVTALGAAAVFLARDVGQKTLDTALGFTAGVMMAASFWSLLAPSIALAEEMGMIPWVPALVGFLAGGVFLRVADHLLPHLHLFHALSQAEGISTKWRKTALLVMAITLHNIPEGLAIGVAFGAVAAGYEGATLAGATALAIGIGLQNFPEGTAVAVPLRREGLSRDDLRRGGRGRARVAERWSHRRRHPRRHGRLRRDDDARRRARLTRHRCAAPPHAGLAGSDPSM